jgi:hypothetical protein
VRKLQENFHITCHFEIDGDQHESAKAVFRLAKERGFKGSLATIETRLKNGARTWDELASNPKQILRDRGKAGADAYAKKRAAEKAEIQAIMDEIDRRKAEMARGK